MADDIDEFSQEFDEDLSDETSEISYNPDEKYADFDSRVWAYARKYFWFLDRPEFISHRWFIHILKHLNKTYQKRDANREATTAKDEKMASLDITRVSGVIDMMADNAETTGEQLSTRNGSGYSDTLSNFKTRMNAIISALS